MQGDAPWKPQLDALRQRLAGMESVVVAFSGGVDSTLLLDVAAEVLDRQVLAVTARSESLATEELEDARRLAILIGADHLIIETGEVEDPEYRANTPMRCYRCKSIMYRAMQAIADERGYRYVANGTNVDDLGDFRMGLKACHEVGVRMPLREAGLTKEDVRAISRGRELPTWNKPAMACLSSRFPYGTEITPEKLAQVGRAERILRRLEFSQFRVRHHGDVARIEVPPGEFPRLVEQAQAITAWVRDAGYAHVTMDLRGYRAGSLNESLHPGSLHSRSLAGGMQPEEGRS